MLVLISSLGGVRNMPKYKIELFHGEPGCGCGCFDNDLNIAEQNFTKAYYFFGTEEQAEKKLAWYKETACPSYGNHWTLTEEVKKPRLVIVSGPSGVGKGPIIDWVKRLFFRDLDLRQVNVRKTKTERHNGNEEDLGFVGVGREYYSFDCRGAQQRIDLDELNSALAKNNVVLLEVYYKALDFLQERYGLHTDFTPVFISPLRLEEIKELREKEKNLEDYLPGLMLESLKTRAMKDGKGLTNSLVSELELRANDSIDEMRFAHNYEYVIPNSCYESDARWKAPFIVGEPLKVVKSLNDIIETGSSVYALNGKEFGLF